jgi:hypothetical protein
MTAQPLRCPARSNDHDRMKETASTIKSDDWFSAVYVWRSLGLRFSTRRKCEPMVRATEL